MMNTMSNAVAALLIADADTLDWRGSTWTSAHRSAVPTCDRPGLERLVQDVIEELRRGGNDRLMTDALPYNLAIHGPAVGHRAEGWFRVTREEQEHLVTSYGRFGGWLRYIGTHPLGRRFLAKTQSSRGVNSPYTTVDLWKVWEINPSPQRFIKRLANVQDRARTILSAYSGGLKPCWRGLGHAMASRLSVGKAATVVTATTIGDFYKLPMPNSLAWGGYAQARQFLVRARGVSKFAETPSGLKELVTSIWGSHGSQMTLEVAVERVLQNCEFRIDDGVESWTLTDTAITRLGITSSRAVFAREYEGETIWDQGYLVERGERTYHSGNHYQKEAVKEAVRSWRLQDEMDRKNAIHLPEDRTLLVYYRDSREAGNCHTGTAAFIAAQGWQDRVFIPVDWLMPLRHKPEVRRVILKRLLSSSI